MLTRSRVKVLDVELAKVYEASRSADNTVSPTLTSPAQTMQSVILGTTSYMSPEQAAGGVVDQRSDIWAFGVVLSETSIFVTDYSCAAVGQPGPSSPQPSNQTLAETRWCCG